MALLTVGLSHHNAPLEVRTRVAFADAELPDALARLHALPEVSESAILSTCNRTELFTVCELDEEQRLLEWWRRERGLDAGLLEQYRYVHRDLGSVAHSLRVAAGLDSMIVGEPQILGQMKQSFALAESARTLGPVLSRLSQHTFAVAKLVRTQTQIGAHPVTMAYAALQLVHRIFADFSQVTALLIGAGEVARLFARYLNRQRVGRIIVVNRSLERASVLAREVGGYAVSLNDLSAHLADADVVVASTASPALVVERETMERASAKRRRKPVFMLDLAVPRDLDPRIAGLEDIYLYTVDDLRAVVEENLHSRSEAARQAEALIETYAAEFGRWLESRDAAGTIQAIRAQARSHRDDVLEKARRKLAAGKPPEEVMTFLADTLSNKLLHAPVSRLRKAGVVEQALLLNGAKKLFDLPDDREAGGGRREAEKH